MKKIIIILKLLKKNELTIYKRVRPKDISKEDIIYPFKEGSSKKKETKIIQNDYYFAEKNILSDKQNELLESKIRENKSDNYDDFFDNYNDYDYDYDYDYDNYYYKNKYKEIIQYLKKDNNEETITIKEKMKEIFNEDEKDFNEYEKQIITKTLFRIKNYKKWENYDYNFKIQPPINLKKNLLKYNSKNNNEKYKILDLINISKKYINKFFEQISKSDINFSQIAFCFIIDCSLFLGNKLKIINLMIILSILKSIEIIDVKFSIFLTADDNFKVLLKKYEENINYEELIEILYETCFLKRFKNNLAKAIKTAVEYLKNTQRQNTIFMIFSDSNDESIMYFNYWINNILNNESNSFIFFIEKSEFLNDLKNKNENKDILTNMWNDFETKTKNEANSKIKIIDLNISNLFIEYNIFNDISNFLNNIKNNNSFNYDKKENYFNKDLDIKHFEELLKVEKFKKYDKIYFFNVPKNSSKSYNDYYNISKPEILEISEKQIPEIKLYLSKLNQSYIDNILVESIFYPNKATQLQLSTRGTEIDIMALILYSLYPFQEPMFYLENKGGFVKQYSITIIIDNSKSCFSSFNEQHSYLTIINLFKILNSMAIPSFTLIVTGNYNIQPYTLLSEGNSTKIFKDESIFNKLLYLLNNPFLNTNLAKAIEKVYNLKKDKKDEKDNYLFILTDGLSHKKDKEAINYLSQLCQNLGIKVFGIGLGIYPYKGKELFDTFIYSENPENLLKAISKIFGKYIKLENELNLISEELELNNNVFDEILQKMETNNIFYFKDLQKELQNIEKGEDVLNNFCRSEKETYVDYKSFNVEEGEDLEIYSKNLLKTQKILMVMLWSYELNEKEELPYISPKYINERNDKNNVCINDTLKHFGIENVVVVDYESAINELLKKNKNGECNYYAVWIFCGPKLPILPHVNGHENTSDPNLVVEFINILIIFWRNGGSLIFFAEGEPLNFQVNLFLEKIEFSNSQKPNFKIAGNYKGDNILEQDKTGKLNRKGVFDKSPKKININGKEIKRQSLSHNLGLIYEGYTIGYAVNKNDNKRITINEKSNLYPFKPFSINSEGGISTLIYEADEQLRGDIIIDCGYTKCFLNMYKTSTFRFIQNIAGWTCRPEIKYFGENLLPSEWRPKGIDYKVNYNAVYNEFINLKTLFAIDYSDSTYDSNFYYSEVENIVYKYYNEKRGDIIYFWSDDYQRIEEKEVFDLIIENRSGCVGGTKIDLIVDIINKEKINGFKQLIIITDGQVTEKEIEITDSRFKEINYVIDYVFVFILGEEPNFSVGVPFCRNIPHKIFYKKNTFDKYSELQTLNKEEILILENINDFADYNSFMNNYEKIFNVFQAQCLGKSQNEILREKLRVIIDKIIQNDNIIDKDLFNKRKNILMGMTKGILKNTFSLEGIKAAIHDYK